MNKNYTGIAIGLLALGVIGWGAYELRQFNNSLGEENWLQKEANALQKRKQKLQLFHVIGGVVAKFFGGFLGQMLR